MMPENKRRSISHFPFILSILWMFGIGLSFSCRLFAQDTISICSWNIANLGRSKSEDEIRYMAKLIKDFDLVAVQEVSSGSGGAYAVARLNEYLNGYGPLWDFVVSDPTSGSGTERYAFLWKKHSATLVGKPLLALNLADSIVREPFHATFAVKHDTLELITFHAVPAGDNPAREIRYMQRSASSFQQKNVVFLGDFNLNSNEGAFDWLHACGMDDLLENVRTTIKMEPKGNERFANPYDNIFYPSRNLKPIRSGRVDFTGDFPTLKDCRLISDHVPIYGVFLWQNQDASGQKKAGDR